MSTLAHSKNQQKKIGITFNPRASNEWSKNESKFGQRMLEKMGWQKGQGLGLNNQGITENLKVSLKKDNRGLGFKIVDNWEWSQVEEGYSSILSSLNQELGGEKTSKKRSKSLETKSSSFKSRVHYHKFTRGKDVSRYKAHDLAGILGQEIVTAFDNTSEDIEEPFDSTLLNKDAEESASNTTKTLDKTERGQNLSEEGDDNYKNSPSLKKRKIRNPEKLLKKSQSSEMTLAKNVSMFQESNKSLQSKEYEETSEKLDNECGKTIPIEHDICDNSLTSKKRKLTRSEKAKKKSCNSKTTLTEVVHSLEERNELLTDYKCGEHLEKFDYEYVQNSPQEGNEIFSNFLYPKLKKNKKDKLLQKNHDPLVEVSNTSSSNNEYCEYSEKRCDKNGQSLPLKNNDIPSDSISSKRKKSSKTEKQVKKRQDRKTILLQNVTGSDGYTKLVPEKVYDEPETQDDNFCQNLRREGNDTCSQSLSPKKKQINKTEGLERKSKSLKAILPLESNKSLPSNEYSEHSSKESVQNLSEKGCDIVCKHSLFQSKVFTKAEKITRKVKILNMLSTQDTNVFEGSNLKHLPGYGYTRAQSEISVTKYKNIGNKI